MTESVPEAGRRAVRTTADLAHGIPPYPMPCNVPFGPGMPPMYMPKAPLVGSGLPPYAMHYRPGISGHPSFNHQMPPEMAVYPPLAAMNFREPWAAQAHVHDGGFEDFTDEGRPGQQQQITPSAPAPESPLTRMPPIPQEVVPAEQPVECQSEEKADIAKSSKRVVVVE
jgi:hypothetical protein